MAVVEASWVDGAEWDGIVPQHPLSRIRAWLPACRQSLRLEPEVLALDSIT